MGNSELLSLFSQTEYTARNVWGAQVFLRQPHALHHRAGTKFAFISISPKGVLTVQCWCFLPLSSLKIGCARQKVTFWTGEKGARLADVRHRVRISHTGKGFFIEGKGQKNRQNQTLQKRNKDFLNLSNLKPWGQ